MDPLQQYCGDVHHEPEKWVRDQNLAFYPPCFTKAAVTQGESFFFPSMHLSSLTEIMHAAVSHSHRCRHHNGVNRINKRECNPSQTFKG